MHQFYPLDRDLSAGLSYPLFIQPGLGVHNFLMYVQCMLQFVAHVNENKVTTFVCK